MNRRGLFWLYAALAVAGAVLPYWIFIPWMAEHGFAPGLFVAELFSTGPASIFASDALLSSVIFLIFMVAEGGRLQMRGLWAPPLAVVIFGLCCGFPLFLAMREHALEKRAT